MAARNDSHDWEQPTDSELPVPKKNGWLYIFIALGTLAVTALILTTIYREIPRRNAIVKRSKTPITRAVYALALSPVDSATAHIYTRRIAEKIGADSASTKMVVGSTHVAQQFVSFTDFRRSIFEACVNARPANLRIQQVLTANIANTIGGDQLPSTLYIIGDIGADNFTDVQKKLGDAIDALQIRDQVIGPLSIVSYPSPRASEKHREMTMQFLDAFRKRNIDIETKDVSPHAQ